MRSTLQEAEILHTIIDTQKIIWETNPKFDDLVELVLERIQRITNASGAGVAFVENGELVMKGGSGLGKLAAGRRFGLNTTLSGLAIQSSQTLYCIDANVDTRVDPICREVGLRSIVVTPLKKKDAIIGVIQIISPKANAFSEAAIQILELAAGWIGAAISRAAEIKHREDLLRQFIQNSPVPVAMFDREMRYIMASTEWIAGMQMTEEEVLGRCHYDLLPYLAERKAIHDRVLAGEEIKREPEYLKRPDGTEDWFKLEYRPWYDENGEIGGLIMSSEIVTAEKEAEDELKRSNEELTQFASLVSHDLQEPMRNIRTYLSLLGNRHNVCFNEEERELVRYATESSKRMCELIRGVLDYSKLCRTEKDEFCDSEEVLTQTLSLLQPTIDATGSRIVHNTLPKIRMNRGQCMLVFQNLLSNAMKFRSLQPFIEILCKVRDDQATFCVRDNGIGIPANYQDRIFKMFGRLHSRDKYSGTGIGLASVKKIVEQAGGRVWLESVHGEGSAFYFTAKVYDENCEGAGSVDVGCDRS